MERYLHDEQYQICMHDKGYTQSNVEEIDSLAMKRKTYVATLDDRRVTTKDQHKLVQPNQGGGSNTVKIEERPEHKQLVPWERKNLTSHPPDPRCSTVVIMDVVTSSKVFQM